MSSCGYVKWGGSSPLVGVVGTPLKKSGTRVAPTACSVIKEFSDTLVSDCGQTL